MRILLVTLNSKYVHTNLALRYLRESIKPEFPEVQLMEFTINEPIERIAGEIFEAKADVIGFSCYIWNISETLAVIRRLRPVCPDARIVLGGPEVSFEAGEFLREHVMVDAVVYGEGEESFPELLRAWRDGIFYEIAGLAWRKDGEVLVNPPRRLLAMEDLPFPYAEDEDFTGRIVYVETTRGCPFNCRYCLSSTIPGVRYLDPERFRLIFRKLLSAGARTVKFVDRTFNVQKAHSFRILDIVREEAAKYPAEEGIRVHCEIAGELLDQEWLDYLKNYPEGLVQFEIGVQSTHEPTLEIISRPQHFERWQGMVKQLQKSGKVPIHLDLIAGLPEEDWLSFRKSFNDVYALQPEKLQLGFLKVLKGSGLREQSERYGLIYSPDPPYTIMETKVLSHTEILQLRRMEEVLDKYYNSGRFKHALPAVAGIFVTPFDFYDELARFWQNHGWFKLPSTGKALFERLWNFIEGVVMRNIRTGELKERYNIPAFRTYLKDALRFDFYLWERPGALPEFLQPDAWTLPKENAALKTQIQHDPRWVEKIPEFSNLDRRQWARATAVAYFSYDIKAVTEAESSLAGILDPKYCTPHSAENPDGGVWYLFFYNKGQVKVYKYE